MDTARQHNFESNIDNPQAVRKPYKDGLNEEDEDEMNQHKFVHHHDSAVNGSTVPDDDDRHLLFDYHGNGHSEDHSARKSGTDDTFQHHEEGKVEDQNLDSAYNYVDSSQRPEDSYQFGNGLQESRDDEEPLLGEDDHEPLFEDVDAEEQSRDQEPDPRRKAHVEGTNVSSSHEGEIDMDGYRIDQHQETEHFSHTREIKELDDHLEIVQQDSRCLKLEEVKTKETVRQATAEEMKALLGAAVFDGKDEIELGTEIIVEGFTRVEQTHEETDAGGVTSKNVTVTETREREEVHEDPNKPLQPSLEGNAPTKEEYQNQLQQVSGNGQPALTTGPSHNAEPLVSQKVAETHSASPQKEKDVEKKDKHENEANKEDTGCMQKHSRSSSKSRGDTLPKDKKGSTENVLKDGTQKVHRGGFFCKQKHNKHSSKGSSPAGTLERDASLGSEEKKKGWSLFGRKSSRRKDDKKKGGLDSSKSDHSTLGDSMDKSKHNSLDRSLNNSSRNEGSPQIEERVTSRISTSSAQEPVPSPKRQTSRRASVNSITSSATSAGYSAVVAVDLGATVSSYSFCFTHDNPDTIYTMKKPEGSDPGLCDPKYPTVLLLTPEGEFHSFGFTARNVYQSLDPAEAVKWMYFDSFRKQLTQILGTGDEPIVKSSNGLSAPAAVLLEHALRYLSYEALQDLSARRHGEPVGKVRWVITAPAGWHTEARHWIRQVAYKVGLATADFPQQLLVMQEPQAAAVSVQQLQLRTWQQDYEQQQQQLQQQLREKEKQEEEDDAAEKAEESRRSRHEITVLEPSLKAHSTSMLVSCGGDEVTVSVYDVTHTSMTLLYQSLINNCGGTGVNDAFVKLLYDIFGAEFIEDYKSKKPAGWADLILSFESYKRALDPVRRNPLNIPLPFSLIEQHQRHFGYDVELAIERYGKEKHDIAWTQQGMLRLYSPAWISLFRPVLDKILEAVRQAASIQAAQKLEYIWLVGGFSECSSLQQEIRNTFKQLKIIVPKETSHVAAKGAAMFGIDPVQISFTQASDAIIPSRAR